jgi:glycosyltransferase involved in cell wall biosynthesis
MDKGIIVALMVKNESGIIERCLSSVIHLADAVVIVDTGSDDNTVVKAGLFLQEKKIPYRIYLEPFKNFGYNRTHLLRACASTPFSHVLMIDADEVLVCGPNFNAQSFKDYIFRQPYAYWPVRMRAGDLSYHLNRLTINDGPFEYIGVTHEFLDTKGLPAPSQFAPDIHIEQVNDSVRRVNNQKFLNDIELMEKELANDNLDINLRCRYCFFLAQSYQAIGERNVAIAYYKERLRCAGWIEEEYYCAYQIGQMLDEKGNIECLDWYIKAHKMCPHRAEAMFNLMQSAKLQWEKITQPASGLFVEGDKYVKTI